MAVKRLIETFVPENYKIFLDIDRKTKKIKGQVAITGEAKDSVIAFHAKGLHFSKVRAFSVDTNFIENEEDEEIVVKIGETGRVTVSFEYEAELTDNMMGIYPSYYEVNGEKKMLIGTQFESHFARQAFPSIDEPEAKATFDLSVKFDEEEGDIIVSNMPELLNINGIHVFERTVKMSSYLLAFVFGELQFKKGKTNNKIKKLNPDYVFIESEQDILSDRHWKTMAEKRQVIIVLTSYKDEIFNEDGFRHCQALNRIL